MPKRNRTVTTDIEAFVHICGRIVIGVYFITQASGVFWASGSLPELAAVGAMSKPIFWFVFGFQFIAAFAVMLGIEIMVSAMVLAVFVLWTSFLFNFTGGTDASLMLFWKDATMAGGLMLVASTSRCMRYADTLRRIREDFESLLASNSATAARSLRTRLAADPSRT